MYVPKMCSSPEALVFEPEHHNHINIITTSNYFNVVGLVTI